MNYYWLAAAYAARGDKEKALATLEKAFDMGFHDSAALDASPYFSSLRTDQRFQQLTQRYRKMLTALRHRRCADWQSRNWL